ncbi:hypothetical protein NX786_15800 [Telluria mixta]|uniref:Uncharacterized protein n=1 Tax=Telluria mixta TaxID=34071 RepID=A0ABT2C089_9BURK|nr:hypothetical protein [Telluria mixta]MCS0630800.1 hypothetical protein [Telluria mixta]WEM98802.1 hypothetical protein P0M04_14175 [Telluria mixta]
MAAVNLDELEHAALVVDDGEGRATALVARATGMIHVLNDDYMDEEAPMPADPGDGDGDYVAVPPASTLGIGDQLVFRFAAAHLAGDQAAIRDLVRAEDIDGFERLLDERGATESWQRFRTEETQAALRRWCDEHGLRVSG